MSRTQEIEQRREDWIDALLSGDYGQGHGALKTWDGDHCCLGVACDRIDPNAWDHDATSSAPPWSDFAGTEYPEPMREHFGLSHTDCDDLAAANDDGEDFYSIAGIIAELPIRTEDEISD